MSTSASPVDIGTLIVSGPGFRDGKPCIAGTGMSVRSVAIRYLQGMSAEAIHEDIPDIPLSHFHAAIARYLANRAAMDAEIAGEEAEADRLEAQYRRAAAASPDQRRA